MITSNAYLTPVTSKQHCVDLIRTLPSNICSLAQTEATRFARQLEQELLDAELANDTQLVASLRNLRMHQEKQHMCPMPPMLTTAQHKKSDNQHTKEKKTFIW